MFKYFPPIVILFLLILGCSSSDSPEDPNPNNPNPPNGENVSLATLTSNAASNITETSAEVGGNISDNGGAAVTERGIVWSLNPNPTVAENKLSIGSGNGSFTNTLSGLEQNTTYYFRAFAVNSEGTSYGNEEQFSTLRGVAPEKIFDGDVLLTSQAEVDEFGDMRYTEITGDLGIGDSNDPSSITNIDALSDLSVVGGELIILLNPLLVNLDGLSSLNSAGSFLLVSNESLVSVEGLSGLTTVQDDMRIVNNSSLQNLNGLHNLKSATAVLILDNNALTNLDLAAIESIPTLFLIQRNGELLALDGFDNLKEVGELVIQDNNALSSLTGFNTLEQIIRTNGIDILDNESLIEISAFNNLLQMVGKLNIDNNEILENISGFSKLTIISGRVDIEDNPKLTTIQGFDQLQTIEGSNFDFSRNQALATIQGFRNLSTVEGNLIFFDNDSLEAIPEFDALSSVDAIDIQSNDILQDYCGLRPLLQSGWTGSCFISGNLLYNPTCDDILNGSCSL